MKTSISDRVAKYRQALRAAGLRPVQVWVPDTRRRGFAQECRRQSLSLRDDPQEKATLKWLAKIAATNEWK